MIVSVLSSVARKRLVETENPSVCATVNCNSDEMRVRAVWSACKRD
jgi:hypothetical protein